MRIIYFSDIHGHWEAFAGLPTADLLLLGGDFTTNGTDSDIQDAVSAIEKKFPRFLAVAGNMDPRGTDSVLARSGHLLRHDAPTLLPGVSLLGLGGSNTCPVPTPYTWEDDVMAQTLEKSPAVQVDILVTHAPPKGYGADVIPNGMHVGSLAVAQWALRLKPRLHLCGHIHEAAGIYDEDGTLLVNPGAFGPEGNHAVIEWPETDAPAVWLDHVR